GLLKGRAKEVKEAQRALRKEAVNLGVPAADADALDLVELVSKGLANQVGVHVYDAASVFDLDLAGFLGLTLGDFSGGQNGVGVEELLLGFVGTSLQSPVYLSVPVRDAKVVDDFLGRLDKVLARLAQVKAGAALGLGALEVDQDFYRARLKSGV